MPCLMALIKEMCEKWEKKEARLIKVEGLTQLVNKLAF